MEKIGINMSYVLREQAQNRYYCKDHYKVIEFDTMNEARDFLNNFANFAMAYGIGMAMRGGIASDISEIQQVIQSTIIEEKPNCNTMESINWKEVQK